MQVSFIIYYTRIFRFTLGIFKVRTRQRYEAVRAIVTMGQTNLKKYHNTRIYDRCLPTYQYYILLNILLLKL